jgi:hypothetical protein
VQRYPHAGPSHCSDPPSAHAGVVTASGSMSDPLASHAPVLPAFPGDRRSTISSRQVSLVHWWYQRERAWWRRSGDRDETGWQTGRSEPPHGLFFRGSQQPADAIGVRDDMMDGRDAGEPGVCRHERLSSCRVGRCGQDRVERAEARSFPEQA